MNTFLERIRNSDDRTKKKWTYGITAVIMLVVVILWFAYVNSIFSSGGSSGVAYRDSAGSGASFVYTMKNGLAVVYDTAESAVRGLWNAVTGSRTYVITPDVPARY